MRRVLLATVFALAAGHAGAADLTLRRVLLSTGGVGYFEYAADVDGPADLGLDVPLAQVDDVLISLVVFDTAGSVGGVELPGQSGTNAAFGDVPFGPDAMVSAAAYLNGLQGVEITVQGPRPMTGRLLRVEPVAEKTNDTTITRTRVSVLTEAGLQQFVLEDAESVQVADPDLRARIARALATLQRSAAHDIRHLTIRSTGTGHRTVTVGYVAGAPLWKTSYRLALPATPGDKARLQGWAVLENESATDWKGVTLTLQSGNPVTFRQAIYRSYYVARPEVPVEVLGRILPGVDPGAISADKIIQALRPTEQGMMTRGVRAFAPPPPPAPAPAAAPVVMAPPAEAAQAAEGSEQTSFTLPTPVVLAAGHTASVPILDREVPAARIGLVQQGRAHPLAAVRVTNDSDSSLPAGVLTLYDSAPDLQFAGDARLSGLPVKDSRMLSFAEDLRTSVLWEQGATTTIANLSAARGVLHYDEKLRTTHRITLTAPPAEPRTLVVEIQKQPDSTLVPLAGPKPSEENATVWRLNVALKPGETTHLEMAVDHVERQATSLTDNDTALDTVLGEQGLDERSRGALRHLVDLRTAAANATAARDQLTARKESIEGDEDRLRKNLDSVPASDALHARLIRQLDAAETQLATLAAQLTAADATVDAAHKALQDGIFNLKL